MKAAFDFKGGNPNNRNYQRQIIDTFVNSVYVYDDKLVFTYNFKDGTETITLEEIDAAFDSDLNQSAPPERPQLFLRSLFFIGGIFMESRKLLADISRQFFKEHKVFKYKMKKVSEMSDDDVIRYCHLYYEENRLSDEWRVFRNSIESNYRYCSYSEEYIEDDTCNNLQMIINGLAVDVESKMDFEELKEHCKNCKYCW